MNDCSFVGDGGSTRYYNFNKCFTLTCLSSQSAPPASVTPADPRGEERCKTNTKMSWPGVLIRIEEKMRD